MINSESSFAAPLDSSVDADIPLIDKRADLDAWLGNMENQGKVVRTRLKTSERVIARVTDGIYRQPSSALRELISNAWDADANNVTILTDAPRFSRIYVRDDGRGMSYETLSRLLHSIGGSAKRNSEGQELGVTHPLNPDLTPGGRLLIGKIGIGLFSISQLSRCFKIVTKMRGVNYRLIAEVHTRAYSEDDTGNERDDDQDYINGEVLIALEGTNDLDAHGTDIILDEIKPRVRNMLRSADRWEALDAKAEAEANGDSDTAAAIRVVEPTYHSGWISNLSSQENASSVLKREPKLPWSQDHPSGERMGLLMKAIEGESARLERPDLAKTLDTYLETIWTLALSVPVGYVDKHPFELTGESEISVFWLSNESRGQAIELNLQDKQTVREAVREQVNGNPELEDGKNTMAGDFHVFIDGFELKRPISFKYIKKPSSRAISKPMLFVGKFVPNLQAVDRDIRGGGFGMEGYLFWNGVVIPKENNGVLVRIRGAAGALFDATFFKYQISELTRLRQIVSELYIRQGLDAALNLDRESFNFSHPHVQIVTSWLHRAIRQLTNKSKDLGKRARADSLERSASAVQDQVMQRVESVWIKRHGSEPMPEIEIASDRSKAEAARQNGFMALSRADLPSLAKSRTTVEQKERDGKAQALFRVLAAFEVLSDRPYEEQQELVEAILQIFFS